MNAADGDRMAADGDRERDSRDRCSAAATVTKMAVDALDRGRGDDGLVLLRAALAVLERKRD